MVENHDEIRRGIPLLSALHESIGQSSTGVDNTGPVLAWRAPDPEIMLAVRVVRWRRSSMPVIGRTPVAA